MPPPQKFRPRLNALVRRQIGLFFFFSLGPSQRDTAWTPFNRPRPPKSGRFFAPTKASGVKNAKPLAGRAGPLPEPSQSHIVETRTVSRPPASWT